MVEQSVIKGLLILPILIPLFIGLKKVSSRDKISSWFILFLVIGLATDVAMWCLLYVGGTENLLWVFNLYSLLEALFFFWFLGYTALSNSIRIISRAFLYSTLPFWLLCIFVYPLMMKGASRSAVFDTTYEVIISFLAGLALLQHVEKEESIFSKPVFWFIFGIFFYCFCTFYIMTFLQTFLSHKIWFLNNIFNIISYVFYSLGFWYLKAKPVPSKSAL